MGINTQKAATNALAVRYPRLGLDQRSGQAVEVPDAAVSDDGQVWGYYLHGLLVNDELRQEWLADEVESVLDMKRLDGLLF